LAEPSGNGEALRISSHTSRVTVRIAWGLPLDALSQIASILPRSALVSVGIALAPRLHDSTAAAIAGLFAGALVAVERVVLLLVVPVLVVPLVVPPLVELLLELPQPVSSV